MAPTSTATGPSPATVTQQPSFSAISTDPLRKFKFVVEFHSPLLDPLYPTLGFMGVSGLSMNLDVIAYRQGNFNVTPQHLPGQTSFSPVTLSKGLIPGDSTFLTWYKQLFSVLQGNAGNVQDGSQEFRCDVDIMLVDHPVTTQNAAVKAVWRLKRAWPSTVVFDDLNANANDIMIAQMTLQHEGWEFALAASGTLQTASISQ